MYIAGRETLPEEYGGRTRWMPPAPLAWAWPEKYGRGVLSTEGLFELVPGLRQQVGTPCLGERERVPGKLLVA